MRFIPATGHEDEESYVTVPIEPIPEFTVTVRPTTNSRWAKAAKKKGLKPDNQEYVQLFDVSEESCMEALIEWNGTQHIWADDGPDGLPVSDTTMKKMAQRLVSSVVEVGTDSDGASKWKSFWTVIQEQVTEQRAVERKN